MNFEYYNPVDEKGGCVVRSISKALDKDYNIVKKELIELSKTINIEDYRDEKVFEKYILGNGFSIVKNYNDKTIKNCSFSNGTYIAFGYKEDWYHLVAIIDNTIFDKNDNGLELSIIKIYKKD